MPLPTVPDLTRITRAALRRGWFESTLVQIQIVATPAPVTSRRDDSARPTPNVHGLADAKCLVFRKI